MKNRKEINKKIAKYMLSITLYAAMHFAAAFTGLGFLVFTLKSPRIDIILNAFIIVSIFSSMGVLLINQAIYPKDKK